MINLEIKHSHETKHLLSRLPNRPDRLAGQLLQQTAALTAILGLTAAQVNGAVADCGWLIYVLQTWLPAGRAWALATTDAADEAQNGDGTALMTLPVFTAPALPTGIVPVDTGALTRIFALVQSIKDGGQCSDTPNVHRKMILAAAFVPTGQPEISQTQGVWFSVQNKIRPEWTAEIHRPFRTHKNRGCVTSHFVAG